jgi:hypothetical protein
VKCGSTLLGLGSLFVAKNRAGMDGILYPIHMDTSKSKIRILGKEEVGEFEDRMEERLEETSKKNDYNAARTLQKVMNDKRDLFTKA